MKLIIKYQSGEQRVINLHPAFFQNPEASVAQRANDIAFDLGKNPYDIQVLRGTKEDYHRIIPSNAPYKPVAYKIDETGIKRHLRKEFKNKPFKELHERYQF